MLEGNDTLQQHPELTVLIAADIGHQPWLYVYYFRAATIMEQFVLLSMDVRNDEYGDIAWTLTAQQQRGIWQMNVPS